MLLLALVGYACDNLYSEVDLDLIENILYCVKNNFYLRSPLFCYFFNYSGGNRNFYFRGIFRINNHLFDVFFCD